MPIFFYFFEINLFGYNMDPITKYTMLMPIHWLLGTGGPLIGWKNGSIFLTNRLMRTVNKIALL